MLLEHEPTGQCLHSFLEFSQTSPSISIKQLGYELKISTV